MLVKISVAVLVAGALAVVGIAVLGGKDEPPKAKPAAVKPADMVHADPRLQQLVAQSNQILGGGREAFDARMKELRGFPVVVNKWASWCGPCKYEMPVLRDVAKELGDEVAFLGVLVDDTQKDAKEFLLEQPIPYPTYNDPDYEISRELPPGSKAPITNIYDASGKLVNRHAGPITSAEDLKEVLERYAGVKS